MALMSKLKNTLAEFARNYQKIFAVHGICNEIVSDNGSQFVSEEFKSYLEELGIKHTRTTVVFTGGA
jgi:transposase InsO family protein